jgi:hypothetical protein
MKLDSFTQQYLETALWSSTDDNGEPLDENYTLQDFAPETIKQAVEDCEAFQRDQAELLEQAYERDGYDASNAGHDFWLSRNGHGAGFFDRGREDHWTDLQAEARTWGTVDLFVADTGEIYGN